MQVHRVEGKRVHINEPFFIFRGRQPVKPEYFRKVLNRTISDIGLKPNNYDCHSLRAGRATDLFKDNVPFQQIKVKGRWKYDAIFKYLKP